jgi:DNA-binding NarL/FixJ family response regulator
MIRHHPVATPFRPDSRPAGSAGPAPRCSGDCEGVTNSQRPSADAESGSVSILIADDHPALRAGLRSLFSAEPGMSVQADVDSGEAAYVWYRAHSPDVVVMDLAMAGYGGMESIHRILAFDPDARILVYTVHTSDLMLRRALDAGALGYVSKGSDIEFLVEGVWDVMQGRPFVSPDMVPALVDKGRAHGRSPLNRLTPREFEIFRLLGEGRSVPACGRILNLSPKTISNHITQIKNKVGAASLADMTRLAIRSGLVEP